MLHRTIITGLLLGLASHAFGLNILLTNDDGLTSNLKAMYEALKDDDHDVIVSVPCSGQSGRGAAILMYSSDKIETTNDLQIEAEGGCHNGAAGIGAPAAGPFTKKGFTNGDYHYVHGSPVLATLYGLEILAQERWGRAPDLVLSGPNEGQNLGTLINSSGTVANVQLGASRGIPSIALSAGLNTVDNETLSDPDSATVAQLSLKLLHELQKQVAGKKAPLLPEGVALNVNFPTDVKSDSQFAFSRVGSFTLYQPRFITTPRYGPSFSVNDSSAAGASQQEDEAIVFQTRVSVTAMQVSFEHDEVVQNWLRQHLRNLFE